VESAEVEHAGRPGRVAAVAAALVLVVAAGVWGAVEHGQARAAQAASGSVSLAQQALSLQGSDPSAAARLAVQAYRLEPTAQARQVLGTLAEDDGPVSRFLRADRWAVDDLVQSPDGRIVYASSQDGALRAWNMESGALVAKTTTGSGLSGLALNPAGTVLTGVDAEGELVAWDAQTLAPRTVPLVESALGFSGAQAADGQIAEAGFYDGGRRYFALADGGGLVTEAWPDDPNPGSTNIDKLLSAAGQAQVSTQDGVEVAAADASGLEDSGSPADTLYVATTDGRVLAVDLDDLSAAVPIGFGEELSGITGIALDPSGGDVAILADGSAGLYSLQSGTHVAPLSGVDAATWGIGFDAVNTAEPYVVAAGSGGVSLEPKPTEDGVSDYGSSASGADPDGLLAEARGGPAQTVALPDGPPGGPGLVAVGAPNGLITIIDPALTGLALPSPEPSTIAAFSPRGQLLLAGLVQQNDSAMAYAIDPSVGGGPSANQSYAVGMVFTPSSSWWSSGSPFFANAAAVGDDYAVVAGQDPSNDPAVFVWNARTGAPVKELRMAEGATATASIATAVADDPALGLIVARDSAGAVEAWSTTTWAPVMTLQTGATGGQLALAPGGSSAVVDLLFAGSGDTLTRSAALGFIDLRAHTIREVTVPTAADMIAVSPTSGEIATEAADSTLRFYHADGTPDGTPSPLGGDGTGLAYNAAGTELAVTTASAGTTVLDAATLQPVGPVLPGPSGSFASDPQWSPDGTIVAVEAGSATAPGISLAEVPGPTQLWDVNPRDWQARLSALTLADAVPSG
jgi:WD40 repeat protein